MAMPETAGAGPRRTGPANLKAMAAQEIRRRVFSGRLRPGAKIDQDALADELGISKLPIREALITLDHEGVVEHIARRGAFVARMTRDDIRDHFRVFGLVSGLAAERAAKNLSPASLQALADHAERMEAEPDPAAKERLNFEFHRRINYAADSRRLVSLLGMLSKTVSHGFYEAHEDWSGKADDDHRLILNALAARSPARARTLVEKHFAEAGERAVALLEKQGFWDH